ncbi:hypothetical protein O6H91_12G016100 [Diphasiastrum complanatum]|uniref:Uncharacterized protein n=1 Tax=Diphasiastrum complanatum TaxID=34168 RepID=A0ACC2BZI7_DIPCM|nr:hypothetical protein O6H91_12G016100 [Diphasiastrum complanatum]
MEDIEVAMQHLIQEHSLRNATLHENIHQSRKEASAVAVQVSNLLVDSVNGGVQEVFSNEKQIELEARALSTTVQRFVKQTNQWLTMFHSLDSTLKEIGDFENWINLMEHDCQNIAKAIGQISSLGDQS